MPLMGQYSSANTASGSGTTAAEGAALQETSKTGRETMKEERTAVRACKHS